MKWGFRIKHSIVPLFILCLYLMLTGCELVGNDEIEEDCLSFETHAVRVEPDTLSGIPQQRWLLTDGVSRMLTFENQQEAERALETIRHYQMNRHCFVGRPDPSLEYWLVSGRAPEGAMEGEDCLLFDWRNLSIEQRDDRWLLLDGEHLMQTFYEEAETEQALAVIQKYRFRYFCFIARPDPSFIYFRR